MTDLKINPNSSSDWRLKVNLKKKAKEEKCKIIPIKSFDLGKTFTGNFIAIEISCDKAKDTWVKGGFLRQKYNSPLFASDQSFFLELDTPNLIKLQNTDSASYRLIFYPPRYFPQVSIKCWEYVGNESSSINQQLEQINQILPQELEEKMTTLLTQLSDLNNIFDSNYLLLSEEIELVVQELIENRENKIVFDSNILSRLNVLNQKVNSLFSQLNLNIPNSINENFPQDFSNLNDEFL